MTPSPVGVQPQEWGCLDYFARPYEEAKLQFSMFTNWQSSNLESVPFPISNVVHLVLSAALVIPIINTISLLALHALGIARTEIDDSIPQTNSSNTSTPSHSRRPSGRPIVLRELPPEPSIQQLRRTLLNWVTTSRSGENRVLASQTITRWANRRNRQGPIDLSNKGLTTLPECLTLIRGVTHLNLSNNVFEIFPEGFFENMRDLQEVNFMNSGSHCDLRPIIESLRARGVTVIV